MEALSTIPHLAMPDPVAVLAIALLNESALPKKATDDAFHAAVSAYHGMDYLLTWNCRHINNAGMKPLMEKVQPKAGENASHPTA